MHVQALEEGIFCLLMCWENTAVRKPAKNLVPCAPNVCNSQGVSFSGPRGEALPDSKKRFLSQLQQIQANGGAGSLDGLGLGKLLRACLLCRFDFAAWHSRVIDTRHRLLHCPLC
jgi:hypothetical protein